MKVNISPCWSIVTILLLNSMILSTNGFNYKRSSNNMGSPSSSPSPSSSFRTQGKSSTSSSSHPKGGLFKKSHDKHDDSDDGSSTSSWSTDGKKFDMEANDDSPLSHHHSSSDVNGPPQKAKGDYLTDKEFQQARGWENFVNDWERKAKDELADAIKENMKDDKGDDDGPPKGHYDGSYHSRDHRDEEEHESHRNHPVRSKNHDDHHRPRGKQEVRVSKDDSPSNYGNQPSNWDWDKVANDEWTKKSDDGQKNDFGKFDKFQKSFTDHEHGSKGDELDEVTGHNEDKSQDQHYGKKLGGWKKAAKSGDHHFESGHDKRTSHNNKFDPNDSFKGWN